MKTVTIIYKDYGDFKSIEGVFLGETHEADAKNYIKPFNDEELRRAIAWETTKWKNLMLKEGIKEEHLPTPPEYVVNKAKWVSPLWDTQEVKVLERNTNDI